MTSLIFYIVSTLLFVSIESNVVPSDTTGMNDAPPDHKKYVAMARYVVHHIDWATVATSSTIPGIKNIPFGGINALCDGPVNNASGVPYFYLTPLDYTARDLSQNSKCTVSMSLAETGFCKNMNYDAEDPRCPRLMLVGKMVKVKINTTEHDFAEQAIFSRHPSFASLPKDHGFFVAKLKIAYIAMLDWFGGPAVIPVEDYFAFNYTNIHKYVQPQS